jgi:hypothetical protein
VPPAHGEILADRQDDAPYRVREGGMVPLLPSRGGTGTPSVYALAPPSAYGKPIRTRGWKRRIQPKAAYRVLRQPSTLLTTAKPLSLMISLALPLQADEVIQ